MKWLALWLASSWIGFAATLTGQVVDTEGKPVSNARIVVFHDLAMILVQRTVSDHNGQYYLNVEPGYFRIFILKKGFQPLKENTVVIAEEKVRVHYHELLPEFAVSDHSAQNLKRILRRTNREPYKTVEAVAHTGLTPEPGRAGGMQARVTTRARQGLSGDVEKVAQVAFQTELTRDVQFSSSVLQERRTTATEESSSLHAQRIEAGITWRASGGFALDMRAQTIEKPAASHLGESNRLVLTGRYDGDFKGDTRFTLHQSRAGTDRHQRLSLEQDFSLRWAGQPIDGALRLADWEQNRETLAQRAALRTGWRFPGASGLGLAGDVDHLTIGERRHTASKLWLTSLQHRDALDFKLASRVGVHRQDTFEDLIQHHQASASIGAVSLMAEYRRDFQNRAYTTADIFGTFLESPLTPYANESFHRDTLDQTTIGLAWQHGSSWQSQFTWDHQSRHASLLHASGTTAFLPNAAMKYEGAGFRLESGRLGARLELQYGRNEADTAVFDLQEVTYEQAVQPFRNKGMSLFFSLHVRNQPNIPAWWLLQDLPWDPLASNPFYEGHLSVQF